MQAVEAVLFYLFAGLSVVAAWALVLSPNIVRKALFLLLTLVGVAGLYFLLAAELLAAVQLIVYAGGTLILIVFGIMLTSRNPFLQLRPSSWELALGVTVGLVFACLIALAAFASPLPSAGPDPVVGYDRVETIGKGLLSLYLAPFEVAAVLLLVVMIGAAYIARRRGR